MRSGAVMLVLLMSGCAYNGMYQARRLTNAAEKAEREGRTIDASSYWGQVTVKAETLLARFPDSKYADEAHFLLGRAYAELSDCRRADPPLRRALPALTDSADARAARLALATCAVQLGSYAEAAEGFRALAGSGTPAEQAAIRAAQARALRMSGRPDEAVAVAGADTGREMATERALALAAAGRVAEALAVADSFAQRRDSLFPWDSVLTGVGARDPAAASALIDRIGEIPGERREIRVSRLLADARRLEKVDPARSERRLTQAIAAGADENSAALARLALVRSALARVEWPQALDSFAVLLAQDSANPMIQVEARPLQAMVLRVRAADTVGAATPQGDMRVFLAAETARDSLRAPALAANLFRRLAQVWPTSPYAPKALLAAELVVPGDSGIRARLDSLYPASPYVARLRGEDPPELRALEDSLGAFALAAAAEQRTGRPAGGRRPPQERPRPGTPGTTVEPR